MANSEEEIWKSHPDIVGVEVSTFAMFVHWIE